MKTLLSIFILLLAPLLASADPTKEELVGNWRYADATYTIDLTFSKDGSFSGSAAKNAKTIWNYAGDWSLSGTTLNYKYTKSDWARVPIGTVDRDKLIEVTKDYFIVEAQDGNKRKYARVK